jgi:hypothetical protein
MANALMSLVFEVTFPSATQKLVALKMADAASDDGSGIWVSIAELARQANGAAPRQVQYCIKALEGCELIKREKHGGRGAKSTNVWSMNVDLLCQLAMQDVLLQGKFDTIEVVEPVESEGANIAPHVRARVQRTAIRVQSTTDKGDASCTQTPKNPLIEPLRASARENLDLKGVARSDLITLTPTDPEFADWLRYMRAKGQFDSVDAAISASGLQVRHRLPPDKRKADEAKAVADRMIGEPTE